MQSSTNYILIGNDVNQDNQLLVNNGDGSFTVQTLAGGGRSTHSIAVADFNKDGFEDVVVGNNGPNTNSQLLINNGDGTFTASNLQNGDPSTTSIATGDFNNDGLEDLFFSGNMVPNKLYLNQGDFQFKDISESAGIQGDNRWYSGVSLIDINKDGFLDIYIAVGGENEPNNNVLYINNQNNTFSEKAEAYGIDDDGYSMHSTFFDYDKDGDLDLYVANYPPTSFTAPVDYYKYMIDNHSNKSNHGEF